MEQLTVARSYATALFELGERTGEHEAFTRAFASVNALVESDPRIRNFLRSPQIAVAEKKQALADAFGDRLPRLFLNFLMVVLDKRRQRLLRAISGEYDRMLDEHLGRLNVAVTLARDPDPTTLAEITRRLTALLQKSVIAHVRVDPEILGGIVVRYGDNVMDGSLRRRLLHLRGRMLQAPLAETPRA
jgi:F-type H+-transporting ATPase subunit delta